MCGCDTAHPSRCEPGLAGRPGAWQWGLVPVGMVRMALGLRKVLGCIWYCK